MQVAVSCSSKILPQNRGVEEESFQEKNKSSNLFKKKKAAWSTSNQLAVKRQAEADDDERSDAMRFSTQLSAFVA